MEATSSTDVATQAGPITIGVEIAESATRLSATPAAEAGGRRWHARLTPPVEPEAAVEAINALVARALASNDSEGGSPGAPLQTDSARRQGRPSNDSEGGSPGATLARVGHIGGIGVALWGELDATRNGTIAGRLPIGWDGFPLVERLATRWGAPVWLETAVAAAALAEARLGAGQGARSMLYVSLGRSVGAAMVSDGRVWHGALGREGMLGHWLVYPDGLTLSGKPAPRCACGALGHLDPIASAQSIVRHAIGRASATDESTAAMLRISVGRAEAMTAPQVVELAAQDDPAAASVIDDAVDALALALVNIGALLDPGVIVIGGPLALAGERFYAPLRQRVAALAASYLSGRAQTPILAGRLEPFAALRGAGLLASA